MDRGEATLSTIISIFLITFAVVAVVFIPVAYMNDQTAQAVVSSATADFGNKVTTTGVLTQDNVDSFEQTIVESTGNSYKVELILHRADTNPGKKTDAQKIGDVVYIADYNLQVRQALKDNGGKIILKEGDYFEVRVYNDNQTIFQMFISGFFGLFNDQSQIYAQYSAPVTATGSI